jgi:hypothetical protein
MFDTNWIVFGFEKAAKLLLLCVIAIQQGVGLLHGDTLAEARGESTGHIHIWEWRPPPP